MLILKKFINKVKEKYSGKDISINNELDLDKNKKGDNLQKSYFQLATSWADDYYTTAVTSRNRYKFAFLVSTALSILLCLSVLSLAHMHDYIPLLVHHYDNGVVSVVPAKEYYAPKNQAEIESELVRYVVNRESYDPVAFTEQYKLVSLMSANEVSSDYRHLQTGPHSLVNELGANTIRKVSVEGINFFDKDELNDPENLHKNHKNLAEVHFTVYDHNTHSGHEHKTPYTAMLSWVHSGIPTNPEVRWLNWNGFTVTDYQRNQRIL